MSSNDANTLFQSEHHPLVETKPLLLEDHCLSLLHRKAYETAAEMCSGRSLLDLGCNHGYGTAIVGRAAARVVGVDLSLAAIEAAKRAHPSIEFLHLLEPRLPFEDHSFEVVTAFQVIEHVSETAPFLREVKRVLKPGGQALFTTPNRLVRLDPGMKPWNPFHVREYAAAELHAELSGTFAQVRVCGLQGNLRLERVERARASRHRRLVRRSSSAQLPSRAAGSLEYRFRKALRRAASVAAKLPLVSNLQNQRFSRYATSDLHYTDQDLDTALDLLAIVRAS